MIDHRRSRYPEALRGGLASLMMGRPEGGGQVLLVTSALPGEGKTTTSLGLARTAALEGMEVLLVDADFHRPRISSALGLKPGLGLAEVLQGKIEPEKALRGDPRSAVKLLAGNAGSLEPARLLSKDGTVRFFAWARAAFDLVIVDTAPLLAVTDARLMALEADKTVLVLRWGSTSRAVAQGCVRLLESGNVVPDGVLVNDVDLRKHARYDGQVSAFARARLAAYYAD